MKLETKVSTPVAVKVSAVDKIISDIVHGKPNNTEPEEKKNTDE